MEFYAEIEGQAIDAESVRETVTIARLPELCASIDSVVSVESPRRGEIYCVWGQFQVSRDEIRNGVRLAELRLPSRSGLQGRRLLGHYRLTCATQRRRVPAG